MTPPLGSSIYETWVLTLKAWAQSPESVSLHDLPVLADDTFTPDTYGRFVDHLMNAMRQANDRWHEGLTRAWRTAETPFDLARELVSLRVTLARRVQLAQHPALPEAIRTSLLKGLTSDIERYQREVEEAISTQRSAGSLDTSWRDAMLAVVRENSFAAVLAYDTSGERPHVAALPERSGPPPAPVSRRARGRRIIQFPQN